MAEQRAATDGRVLAITDLYPEPGRHAWIGTAPPFAAVPLDVAAGVNCRLPGHLHGTFESVWHVETSLADHTGGRFELILDELVRLLGARGRLVIRLHETAEVSVINVKQALGRRYETRATLGRQWSADGGIVVELLVDRLRLDDRFDRRWTFAVITQGNKPDMVARFLESVRSQDGGQEHELLVWGPPHAAYAPYGPRVENRAYRADAVEIARKKNDIAVAAGHANLLIAHDRYTLDPGFLAGFETFGYDFDLVAVAQRYDDGHPFPAYCAVPGHALVRPPTTIECREANRLWPLQFVGGGLIVAKTRTLREIRLNDLLLWCEAEDVELARAFRERGLPPRMNPWSRATTHGVDRHWFTDRHFTSEACYREGPAAEPPAPVPAPPTTRATPRPAPTLMGKVRREIARVARRLRGGPR